MSVWDLNSRLQPSRLQLLMLGGLYLVALAGVWLAVLPLGVQIFASGVLAFSAWLAWRRWLRPHRTGGWFHDWCCTALS